ncbi:MAG TPA: sigma-70 family RNA polymerase sigma factor [Alloacidobacterium sp.]|nr:sigma-70 family RNA polymerase sigma factor [Alloacidobacterium sp.]
MTIHRRALFDDGTAHIVATQAEERSLKQVQRDIYDSHCHRVFSIAFHMTGNEVQAEQLLADSFIRAFQAEPKPDAATIDHALVSELQSRFSLAPEESAPVDNTVAVGAGNIRRTDLEEAIRELPPVERLVFLLRDVESYTPVAVSQLLGMPAAEITRTLFSARIRLRGILAELQKSNAA